MAVQQIEIDTPRGRFAARTTGEPNTPLVLCIHGFPDNANTFDDLLEKLAARNFRVVAPFCRGYAPSPLTNPDGSPFGKDFFDVLSRDCLAIADALAPGAEFHVVGHDNGAFTVYHLLRLAPERIMRAVTMTAGHPAVFANTARSPRQLWRSRYAVFFQIPGISEWYVRKNDFAYVEELWRRWAAPGWTPPREHAELVVLSGCRTGLGKEIKGEGLVGLTRGFMYAGARRVLVSLWDVSDEASAELMTKFYKKMLGEERLRPAAAFRAAQFEIWKEKRWHYPYYWAAFVLQGEPK